MSLTALIVDDQSVTRDLFEHSLRKIADQVYLAEDLATALRIVHERPDLHIVTLDLAMPGSTPDDVLASIERIHTRHPHCAVIVLSGDPDELAPQRAADAHADAFIQKNSFAQSQDFLAAVLLALYGRAKGNPPMLAQICELTTRLFPAVALPV